MTRNVPRSRAECVDGPRPCSFGACRYHLGPKASVRHSCALDAAAEGPRTLEEVAQLMGVTREFVRSVEQRAMFKLRPVLLPLIRENDASVLCHPVPTPKSSDPNPEIK